MTAHGIMFHHFCNYKNHLRGQGAIDQNEFEKILDFLGDFNILDANKWLEKATNNELEDNDICITFDDGLRCQYDVALPVLEKRKLTAFWFVYSNIYDGYLGRLEIYRYYRTAFFRDIEEFYDKFFNFLELSKHNDFVKKGLKNVNIEDHLKEFNFYSRNDKKFRFIRDKILGQDNYFKIMDELITNDNLDLNKLNSHLWMDERQIQELSFKGHVIGLHSYSHPTELASMSTKEQKLEYEKNFYHLSNILSTIPITMSHPCNSYNKYTLEILDNLGVKLGFRSNSQLEKFNKYEFPRIDHAILMKELQLK